jgi:hypothetical protein
MRELLLNGCFPIKSGSLALEPPGPEEIYGNAEQDDNQARPSVLWLVPQ